VVPIKLNLDCRLLGFKEEQVHLAVKQRIYFRIELVDGHSLSRLEKLMALTPETRAELPREELEELIKGINFYLSSDTRSWARATDPKAIKEIFGLGQGELSLGMSMDKVEGLWLMMSVIIHEKQA
jgi:hypothetical protein